MALPLRLTSEQADDLRTLATLKADELTSLKEALKAPPTQPLSPRDLHAIVAGSMPNRSAEDLERILRQILSLYRLRLTRQRSGAEIVAALAAFLKSQSPPVTVDETALTELASLPSVLVFVKALDLTYEHDRLLQDARILTDVRPVFSEDASKVEGSIVSYTLRLRYYSESGLLHALSIAMDSKDLDELTKQCARASIKGTRARDLMAKSGPSIIAGQDEDVEN